MTVPAERAEVRPSGPPWLRLSPTTGWRAMQGGVDGLVLGERGLRLGVPGRQPIPDAETFGSFGGRKRVAGLAAGADGRLYLADPAGRRILNYVPPDAGRAAEPGVPPPFRTFWAARPLPESDGLTEAQRAPSDPYTLVEPRDVTVTRRSDIVVADAGAGRVLIAALPSL
jgi:hypothetical protein